VEKRDDRLAEPPNKRDSLDGDREQRLRQESRSDRDRPVEETAWNQGTDRPADPRSPEELEGETASDRTVTQTPGGVSATTLPSDDSGIYHEPATATTPDGGLAIDGGGLPGNKDKFEHELRDRIHHVPGTGEDANTGTHKKEKAEE
jgi:hypothetical protein